MEDEASRFERGLALMREANGTFGERFTGPLDDLGRYVVEFVFGDIYARDGLTMREREMTIVTALTALGAHEPELGIHMRAAMRVGVTEKQLEEIVIQTVPYAGFPHAIKALRTLRRMVAGEPPDAETEADEE